MLERVVNGWAFNRKRCPFINWSSSANEGTYFLPYISILFVSFHTEDHNTAESSLLSLMYIQFCASDNVPQIHEQTSWITHNAALLSWSRNSHRSDLRLCDWKYCPASGCCSKYSRRMSLFAPSCNLLLAGSVIILTWQAEFYLRVHNLYLTQQSPHVGPIHLSSAETEAWCMTVNQTQCNKEPISPPFI